MITLPLEIMGFFNYKGQNIKTNVSLLKNAKTIRNKYIKLQSAEIYHELQPKISEPNILPLALVLNHIGLRTSSSGEGHFLGLEGYFQGIFKCPIIGLPYVSFHPLESREKEEEILSKLNFIINNIIKTHYLWKADSFLLCLFDYGRYHYKITINEGLFSEYEKLKGIEKFETRTSEISRIQNNFKEDINTLALGILFHFDRFPSESETHGFKEFYFLDEYGKGFLPSIMLIKLFGLGFQDILKNFIQPAKEPYSEVAFKFLDGFDFCLKIPQISELPAERLWQAWHYAYADDRYI